MVVKESFLLKILTPLHVGSGQVASPLEFFVNGKTLFFYSFEEILSSLLKLEGFESHLSVFKNPEKLKTPEEMTSVLKKLLDVLGRDLEESLLLYQLPFKGEMTKASELHLFIKSQGKVFIPGSEVKGSIRRALLSYFLKKYLKSARNLKFSSKKEVAGFVKRFENLLFRYGEQNAQWDLLRFLKVSDTELLPPQDSLEVVDFGYVYTSGKKKGKEKWLGICESLKLGLELKLTISFEPNKFKKLLSELKKKSKIKKEDRNILQTVNSFFRIFESESPIKEILKICHEETKREYGGELQESGYLLRLGKYEGKFSVTVAGALSGITGEKKPITEKRARREGEKLPFGFCLLKPFGG
jgi:CRISPR type III-A-associated RAMP protein Csm5